MKLIADENGRLACKSLFTPKKPFSVERQPDGSIRVVELVEREVPTIKARRVNGRFRWPEAMKPTRQQIAAAIRADRDSR